MRNTAQTFKSQVENKEGGKTEALINLNSAGDSFSEKLEEAPK